MLKPLSKKIRKFLLEKHEVISIDEFKGLVFKAVVPTSIIFFRKKNQDFQNEISVAYDIRDIEDFIFKRYPKKKLNQRVLCKEPYFYINIYAEENFWEVYNRVSMMSGFMKLGELAEIYNGIQTGRDKKYVSEEKKSDKWEKVIVGSDIDLYYKKWGGKYVHYIPKELHSNTRQEIFKAKEKIIIRQTSDRIIGTYDNEKYFTLASTFNIVQFTRRISYKSLLAILNSKLFLYFYRNINNEAGRVLPQIKKKHIFDLPICIDIDDTELINLVDQALVMRDKIEDGNKLEFREILKHIDGKIYDIYGLSKEEIRVIEESPLIGNQRPNFS
jgi:hypothetical protein